MSKHHCSKSYTADRVRDRAGYVTKWKTSLVGKQQFIKVTNFLSLFLYFFFLSLKMRRCISALIVFTAAGVIFMYSVPDMMGANEDLRICCPQIATKTIVKKK